MKKFTLLFVATLLVAVSALSQSQRMVLAEEFTSATCGPCASQNPAFDALLAQNPDIITSIKYHMSWPSPGNDPMYLQNPTDNNARRAYYGINSVPHVHMDGGWWNGTPSQVNQARINMAAAIPSPFTIQVQHQLSANADSIYITTLINATDNVSSGDLRVFVVVIEKHIHFNSPPGTNGERDFYNVMKKMLPTNAGKTLPSSFTTGQYMILTNKWALENVYDNDELAVVVFIQDYATKEVYQTAHSSVNAISPLFANDAELTNVYYATDKNCSGTMTPKLKIRNNGSDAITSMDVRYFINGGDTTTINWTGNLNFLDVAEIQLPQLSFPLEDTNHLVVEIASVNGTSDDYPANNNINHEFYRADILGEPAVMFLWLDDNPDQTTWKLFNYAGDVVQEGGPYTNPNSIQTIILNFPSSSCYRLEIYDSGNDGLTGNGFYQVVYGTNSTAFTGGDFSDKDVNEITYDVVGIDEQEAAINLKVYPNPASDNLSVSFTQSGSRPVSVLLYDMLGKVIQKNNLGIKPAGSLSTTFNVSKLETGVYIVKVLSGKKAYFNKVFVK